MTILESYNMALYNKNKRIIQLMQPSGINTKKERDSYDKRIRQ